MPRAARLKGPENTYHIIVRGNNKQEIFMTCTVYAQVDSLGYDSNHLRIFTPYHNVKSVFNDRVVEAFPGEIEQSDVNTPDNDIQRQITKNEIDLIACIVHAESKGEPFEGKVGVASVILNRLYHPDFPKTINGIVYERNAFSCIKNGSINSQPDEESYKAVDEALNGYDPTGSAIFFYNPKTASSRWVKEAPKSQSVTIVNHIFFR